MALCLAVNEFVLGTRLRPSVRSSGRAVDGHADVAVDGHANITAELGKPSLREVVRPSDEQSLRVRRDV